jgi:AraC-like DNA-binding protein
LSADQALVLSGSTEGYREFPLAGVLNGHFLCVWSNVFPGDQQGRLAVVPDGCVDVIWANGTLMVAGPDVSVALSLLAPGANYVGIRFRPGAARNWLRLPMSEIVGARLALADLWGESAHEIENRINDAGTVAARMTALGTELGRLAGDVEPPSTAMGFVFTAFRTESAGAGMANILQRLDVSPRTLRRRCVDTFGYGPKTLDRILRFQRFLRLAKESDGRGLAALAFKAGYADQAHLTREVRRLSGFLPAGALSQIRG